MPTDDELISSDEEAWKELRDDNGRRMVALTQQGMQIGGLDQIYLVTLLEHLLGGLHGTEGLMAARLDCAGRISHILDDAEKQLEQAKKRAKLSVIEGGVSPGFPGSQPPGGIHLPGRNEHL